MSKFHRSLCVSFSRIDAGLCINLLFVWTNLDFLLISQWITLPIQSCLVLYSLCANLLLSLITWLMISSLSPLNLHLLFCCVLSILALIWLVLMAFFCAYYYYYYYSLIRAFHISNSRWFFTEVWVTASLLKSPGLFLVFCPFSIMLSFGWSPLVRQLPSPLVPLVIP